MKIETKFNVKDTVSFIFNDMIQSKSIIRILVEVERDIKVYYECNGISDAAGFPIKLAEYKIFASKEELINSL